MEAPGSLPFRLLADAVLVLHLGVVLFVIGGLVCIIVGNRLRIWPWANSLVFRIAHLAAIGVVVAQAWLGQTCPLTSLESWLRIRAGVSGYEKGFIEDWVHWLIFYRAPGWVFTLAYTGFAGLVIASWLAYPPLRRTRPPSDLVIAGKCGTVGPAPTTRSPPSVGSGSSAGRQKHYGDHS